MRYLFFSLLLSSSVSAFDAYRYNLDPSICFHNLQISNDIIISTYIQNGESKELEAHVSWYNANTTEAYYYNNQCNDNPYNSGLEDSNATEDWQKLGITQSDYNFLMGLMANLLGFTLVFMVSFLFILQGRR